MIEGIHDKNAVTLIDKQTCGQLKVSKAGALAPEIVEKSAFAVEYLNYVVQSIGHIDVVLRIQSNSFRPEEVSLVVPHVADGILEVAVAIQHLDAKVHGIHHDQVWPLQAQPRGEVELAVAAAIL